MSKRQQAKIDYIEKHVRIAMHSICKSFSIPIDSVVVFK